MDKVIGHGRFKDGKLVSPSQKEFNNLISNNYRRRNEINSQNNSNSKTFRLIIEYIGYALLITGIFLLSFFTAIATRKPPKIRMPKSTSSRRLSSDHYTKTRQRRAMYAKKYGGGRKR